MEYAFISSSFYPIVVNPIMCRLFSVSIVLLVPTSINQCMLNGDKLCLVNFK